MNKCYFLYFEQNACCCVVFFILFFLSSPACSGGLTGGMACADEKKNKKKNASRDGTGVLLDVFAPFIWLRSDLNIYIQQRVRQNS